MPLALSASSWAAMATASGLISVTMLRVPLTSKILAVYALTRSTLVNWSLSSPVTMSSTDAHERLGKGFPFTGHN